MIDSFLFQYMNEWSRNHTLFSIPQKDDTDLFFQYHMRVLSAWREPDEEECELERATGILTPPNALEDIYFREMRYSVGLKTTWTMDLPIFSMVVLMDDREAHPDIHDVHQWNNANIHPSIRATGVAAFALRIRLLCEYWKSHWAGLLDYIDKALKTDVSIRQSFLAVQPSSNEPTT